MEFSWSGLIKISAVKQSSRAAMAESQFLGYSAFSRASLASIHSDSSASMVDFRVA
jgi:hypothetical protein